MHKDSQVSLEKLNNTPDSSRFSVLGMPNKLWVLVNIPPAVPNTIPIMTIINGTELTFFLSRFDKSNFSSPKGVFFSCFIPVWIASRLAVIPNNTDITLWATELVDIPINQPSPNPIISKGVKVLNLLMITLAFVKSNQN